MEYYCSKTRQSSDCTYIRPLDHFDGWQQSDYDAAKARYDAFHQSLLKDPLPSLCGGGGTPLVNRCISQNFPVEEIHVYPSSVKLLRQKYTAEKPETSPPLRGEISGFSDQSKRKLRFLAGNTSQRLISQFCLTYHKTTPDGSTVKKHLNTWLTNLRQKYSGVAYLWVLEFQTRGVPHFHVWLSLPHDTVGLQADLAQSWHRIAEPDSPEHLRFHMHKRNLIAWDMYSSSYLTKYLDKECQKCVPAGFVGCGRFWGNSRGLLATPELLTSADLEHLDEIDHATGEIKDTVVTIVRTLGKHHERKLQGTPWHSRVRKGITTVTLQTSAKPLRQILQYLTTRHQTANDLPF